MKKSQRSRAARGTRGQLGKVLDRQAGGLQAPACWTGEQAGEQEAEELKLPELIEEQEQTHGNTRNIECLKTKDSNTRNAL